MRRTNRQQGFSLVELAVVIVIIGILAGFAVPKFLNSVERSKAAEAFNYLSTVHAAQERYHARHGIYAASRSDLDADLPVLDYFETDGIHDADEKARVTAWSMTLTRKGAPAGFGEYTVVFDQNGFSRPRSTIVDHPGINPMRGPKD